MKLVFVKYLKNKKETLLETPRNIESGDLVCWEAEKGTCLGFSSTNSFEISGEIPALAKRLGVSFPLKRITAVVHYDLSNFRKAELLNDYEKSMNFDKINKEEIDRLIRSLLSDMPF